MQIRAKCKYDLASVKALARLQIFKKANPKNRMILWTAIYGILLAVLLLEMFLIGPDVLLIVLMAILVVVYLLECFFYFQLPKLQYRGMAKLKDVCNAYEFTEQSLRVTSQGESFSGSSELPYQALVKAYETSRYLFLFQTKQQVLMVDTATVTGGTVAQLRKKLRSVLGENFIQCNY